MATLDQIRAIYAAAPGITLAPPATAAAIAAFETRFAISLPAAYRDFVATVGDGLSLDGEPMLYGLDAAALATSTDRIDPAQPFAYDDAATAALITALAAAGPGGALADRTVMSLQKSGSPPGCIVLTCNGGNDFSILVTTGPQRGLMWRTGELDAPELRSLYHPGSPDHAPLDFSSWLPEWSSCFLGIDLPLSALRSCCDDCRAGRCRRDLDPVDALAHAHATTPSAAGLHRQRRRAARLISFGSVHLHHEVGLERR